MINHTFAALGLVYVGTFAYIYSRYRDRLPLHKYLSNHVFFLAPLNFLFAFFSRGQPAAVFEPGPSWTGHDQGQLSPHSQ